MATKEAMFGVSVTQPWATLIALSEKRYETRSWMPSREVVGSLIAIHSAKNYPEWARKYAVEEHPYTELLSSHGLRGDNLPLGVVLAVARLKEVHQVANTIDGEQVMMHTLRAGASVMPDNRERILGNYATGRYVWEFDDVVPLPEMLHARGNLRMWYLSGALQREVARQLETADRHDLAAEVMPEPVVVGPHKLEDFYTE